MNFWKCKSTSKPWIIAIVLIIFLIGVIYFLIKPRIPAEVPTVPPPTPTKLIKTRPPTKLSIINISSISTIQRKVKGKFLGYCIDKIALNVKNDRDLPAHISRVDLEIDTVNEDFTLIPKEEGLILPGETATITVPFKRFCHLKKGKYTASIKLMVKERKTVATHKEMISIP